MITDLTVGARPISFGFLGTDIIKIDEAKKQVVVADSVTRVYKDTLDDGDSETTDISFQNAFPSLRTVTIPYGDENGDFALDASTHTNNTNVTFIDKVKSMAKGEVVGEKILLTENVESLSDSKIVVELGANTFSADTYFTV